MTEESVITTTNKTDCMYKSVDDKSMFLYLFFISSSPSSNVTHAMLSPNPVLQSVDQWLLGATSMFVLINVFLYIYKCTHFEDFTPLYWLVKVIQTILGAKIRKGSYGKGSTDIDQEIGLNTKKSN